MARDDDDVQDDQDDAGGSLGDQVANLSDDHQQSLVGGILSFMKDQGVDLSSVAGALGLTSTDPGQMTDDDAAKVTDYAHENHPEALASALQDNPQVANALQDIPGIGGLLKRFGGGLGGLMGLLGGGNDQ